MRINRLDLLRYGRFSGAEITFPRRPGTPDVTLVYGPNEAGKSTAFHGYLDLLFGLRAGAHPYAFRYERSDLLIGAELELPGQGRLTLRRNGKRSGSLMDAEGRPLSDSLLTSALHGLSRETYEERFSLNDKGLREGGERIAAAKGDLGQLLHAGVSGLTGMAGVLDALSARADRFHKKRGRATELKQALDRLAEIRKDRRASLLTAEREQALTRATAEAARGFEAAEQALRQSQLARAAAQAAQVWQEESARIAELERDLATYPDGPTLPPGAAEQVAALVEKTAALRTRLAEAEAEIDRQQLRLAAHPEDPQALRLGSELDRLDALNIDGAPLLSRATTARADLARRQAEAAELAQRAATLRTDLGLASGDLPLGLAQLETLAEASETCARLSLQAEAARATQRAAAAQLGEAPPEPRDLTALRRAQEALQRLGDLSLPTAERDRAAARLTSLTAALPQGWRDCVARGLPAPDQIETLARRLASASADLAAARRDLAARAEDLARAEAEHAALAARPDTVELAATEASRRARDMAWQRHLDVLTAPSAADFATAMEADDTARAHYLLGAEARQRLTQAETMADQARARHQAAQARVDRLTAEDAACIAEGAALAAALALPAQSPVSALLPRHQALVAAAGAHADLANAEAALSASARRRAEAETALAAEAATLDLPLPAVERALALEESQRAAWEKWQQNQGAVTRLASAAEAAEAEAREAARSLALLAEALPLPDREAPALRAALPRLRSLVQLQEDHRRLTARIAALDSALAALAESAQRLRPLLGPATEATPQADPLAVIDAARARHASATRAAEIRAETQGRLAETEAARQADRSALAAAQQDLDGWFTGQAQEDLPPRERMTRLTARDSLRSALSEAERTREKARAGVEAALFDAELARLPDVTRAAVLERATAEAQEARDLARDALREAERLHRAAFAEADRSDLATEEATLLEELRQGARSAALARLGGLAARGALRQLAQERRSDMLQDVEEAFVTMTAPMWTGVDVWSEAEGEKLVGLQPSGASVPVADMSTGTMGQLYFALRLAGYRGFARAPGPLPMILDDIMETFDDTRARAALSLCAGIGTVGQAVLFTHHAHLVALAEATIPGLAVVEMPQ